ncbi:hypothetical protein [Floridanema evergladense]|uniref:Uncharacterized protein n=1 Tax=Floridaenema evergladense BLCC-F167 TaxID=3153639 RepID=A0ABV4WKQ9_9CYAN
MKKSIFCSTTVILLAASCLLFDRETQAAKFSTITDTSHPESHLLSDSETLLARRLRRSLPAWVGRVPTRSRGQWLDEEKGIYRSNRGSIIGPYGSLANHPQKRAWLQRELQGQNAQAHHLIERRFARIFGMNENDIPSVLLTKEQHSRKIGSGGIHERINQLIRPGNRSGSRRYNPAKVLQAYREAYKENDDWIDAIGAILRP